ncbi:MAG: hypothetical protein SWH68_15900 [Thermodesulfobacteriota bacterium]|nr:hypothetical protein [Thermodesulfobacteriota bacterium]
MNYKKYLWITGAAALSLLSAVACFNYFVDPYNLMGNNRTGVYFWNERQIKDAILSYDHEAILIGSSKTGYVDTDDLNCYTFYNASLRGGVPEEMYYYLKAYLRNEKLVIIAFDFYMFNEREFPLKHISDWKDIQYSTVEYLLGAYTAKASYKTLKKWMNKEKIHDMKPNGQFVYPEAPAPQNPPQAAGDKIKEQPTDDAQRKDESRYNDIIKGLMANHYYEFSFSRNRMAYVEKIKTLLENRRIPYAVVINPLNEDVLAALEKTDAYDQFIEWRKQMKTIFPGLCDFSSSRYSAREGFHSNDPYHYTNQTGINFLNEVIGDFCAEKPLP